MKNTKKFGLLVMALAINTVSYAQLGGMLKKAAKNVATDQATKAVTGSTSSSSSSSSNSGSGRIQDLNATRSLVFRLLKFRIIN